MPSFFHSEVLGEIGFNGSDHLLTATVEGRFDATGNRVIVHRDSFLRPTDISLKDTPTRPSWLPAANDIAEPMDRDEAGPFVSEIFTKWVRQIRAALESAAETGVIHRHH
jgi:hypothetical protein